MGMASDTPIQIAHRNAQRVSSSELKIENPGTLRVNTFPARATMITTTADTAITRAIRAAAWE